MKRVSSLCAVMLDVYCTVVDVPVWIYNVCCFQGRLRWTMDNDRRDRKGAKVKQE